MSVIQPYSGIASSNLLQANSTNFPALKHYFPCNEATSATAATLTDTVGGVVLTVPTSLTNNGDGTVTLGAAVTAIQSGSFVTPAGKKTLIVTIGKPGAGAVMLKMGATGVTTTLHGISIAAGTSFGRYNDGTTAFVTGAPRTGDGTSCLYALSVDIASATGLLTYTYDGTTYTAGTPVNMTSPTPAVEIAAYDAGAGVGASAAPSMLAVFQFTAMPGANELQSALCWMYNYGFTKKAIYPGWKGRT